MMKLTNKKFRLFFLFCFFVFSFNYKVQAKRRNKVQCISTTDVKINAAKKANKTQKQYEQEMEAHRKRFSPLKYLHQHLFRSIDHFFIKRGIRGTEDDLGLSIPFEFSAVRTTAHDLVRLVLNEGFNHNEVHDSIAKVQKYFSHLYDYHKKLTDNFIEVANIDLEISFLRKARWRKEVRSLKVDRNILGSQVTEDGFVFLLIPKLKPVWDEKGSLRIEIIEGENKREEELISFVLSDKSSVSKRIDELKRQKVELIEARSRTKVDQVKLLSESYYFVRALERWKVIFEHKGNSEMVSFLEGLVDKFTSYDDVLFDDIHSKTLLYSELRQSQSLARTNNPLKRKKRLHLLKQTAQRWSGLSLKVNESEVDMVNRVMNMAGLPTSNFYTEPTKKMKNFFVQVRKKALSIALGIVLTGGVSTGIVNSASNKPDSLNSDGYFSSLWLGAVEIASRKFLNNKPIIDRIYKEYTSREGSFEDNLWEGALVVEAYLKKNLKLEKEDIASGMQYYFSLSETHQVQKLVKEHLANYEKEIKEKQQQRGRKLKNDLVGEYQLGSLQRRNKLLSISSQFVIPLQRVQSAEGQEKINLQGKRFQQVGKQLQDLKKWMNSRYQFLNKKENKNIAHVNSLLSSIILKLYLSKEELKGFSVDNVEGTSLREDFLQLMSGGQKSSVELENVNSQFQETIKQLSESQEGRELNLEDISLIFDKIEEDLKKVEISETEILNLKKDLVFAVKVVVALQIEVNRVISENTLIAATKENPLLLLESGNGSSTDGSEVLDTLVREFLLP